jgi:hypothetical protein
MTSNTLLQTCAVCAVVIRIGRLGPMAVPTACASRWDEIRASFGRHRDDLAVSYPDAVEEIGLIHTALIKIGQLIRSSSPNTMVMILAIAYASAM